MIDSATCRDASEHYKALSKAPGISSARASVLKNIARSFRGLSTQLDRLAALTRDEARTDNRPGSVHRERLRV